MELSERPKIFHPSPFQINMMMMMMMILDPAFRDP